MTTDHDSRLYRKSKGQEAHLSYLGHALTDNRHGLTVGAEVTQADGCAERQAALSLLDELPGESRKTLGADKAYDTNRASAIDGRTSRHEGYEISQNARRKQAGHTHKWQYDEVQLIEMFELNGFSHVDRMGYHQSRIPDIHNIERANFLIVEGIKEK